jgi:hypothetical protein
MRTSPVATFAPARRALIKPERSLRRSTLTLGKCFLIYSSSGARVMSVCN